MKTPDTLYDKKKHNTSLPVEDNGLQEQKSDLGSFAINGVTEEITQETIKDIKAFLRFVQEQKNACSD